MMREFIGCLIVVAGSLPLTFITHFFLCRWHRCGGRRPTQRSALAAALFTTFIAAVVSGIFARHRDPFWPPVLYSTALSGAIAYVYFVMFCNTESGRRYHVLEMIFDSQGTTLDEVHSAYSTSYVLSKRLERLRRWGVIEESAGRLRIRKQSSSLGARMFCLWGRLLKFPVWNCVSNCANSSDPHTDKGLSPAKEARGTATQAAGRSNGIRLACAYLLVLAVTAGYCYKTGLVLVLADSYFLVDRSKHIALQGNFNLSEGTGLAYPPLYSVLLSPAYLLSKPRAIEIALRFINVLIYSLTVFPIWGLLRSYCKLNGRLLWIGSVFLALLPCTLPWASILLTEVLFLPLMYWFYYGLVRFMEHPSLRRAILLGFILGLCHLTREAAGVVVASFLAVGLLDTVQTFRQSRSWAGSASRYAVAIGVYGFMLLCWRLFESTFVVMPNNQGYGPLVWPAMKKTLTHWADFSLHISWFVNCLLYYLTSSLTIAGVFVALLCTFRPRLVLEDLFLCFSLLCVGGSALCIFLFFFSFLGGPSLAWNKYLVPYVLPIPLIALRYRASASWLIGPMNSSDEIGRYGPVSPALTAAMRSATRPSAFGWTMLSCCIALLGILCLELTPCRIECFMPDSLTCFTIPRYCFGLSETARAAGYFLAVVLPLGLARLPWRWGKVLGLISLCGVWWFTSLAACAYWMDCPHNQRHYTGLGKRIYQILRQEPSLALYHEVPYIWTGVDLKAKFYLPPDVPVRRLEQIASTSTSSSDREILFLTTRSIAGHRPIELDWCRWKLYRFSFASIRQQYEVGLGGAEVLDGGYEFAQFITKDGKPVFATEMKPSFRIKAFSSRPGMQAEVRLRVATLRRIPKDIQLHINGQPIGDPVHVGPEYNWPNVLTAKWRLPLETEETILEFTVTPDQPISAPRPAGVLLVEEPEVELLPYTLTARKQ